MQLYIRKDTFMIKIFKKFINFKQNNKTYIITFANYNYLPVLENWLEALKIINVNNFMVISLDEKIHNYLLNKNINSRLKPCELDLGKLWIHRVEVIAELLDEGYDIIHTDADAVWLKNPISYLNKIKSDMIFSQGTHWPNSAYKKWNFVLCCGFFYLKNRSNTKQFIKKLLKRVKKDRDDQVSCNNILLEDGVEWTIPKDTYTLSFREKEFLCSKEIIFGKTSSLEIALLPHNKFQRISETSKEVYVKHLISEKNSDDIMTILEESGCKFI